MDLPEKRSSEVAMRVVIFGATGMVGQGALRESLRDPQVERVVSVVRAASGKHHERLREIVHKDFLDFTAIENELTGVDACLYCLGVTSSGLDEQAYSRVTYEFTVASAKTLLRLNPGMTFVFVSGTGADSSERGKVMWAGLRTCSRGIGCKPRDGIGLPALSRTSLVRAGNVPR